uniref:Uncharacterized protein n=1 Tax=Tetranychus urticae TaxID=32264 RepID=T1KLX0_TETUR
MQLFLVFCIFFLSLNITYTSAIINPFEWIQSADDLGQKFYGRMKDTAGCVKGHQYGCRRGRCWAKCGGFGRMFGADEWCYTGRHHSQSYKYARCRRKSDCNRCWKCAGPCSL